MQLTRQERQRILLHCLNLLLVCRYVVTDDGCQQFLDCTPTLHVSHMTPSLENLCWYQNYKSVDIDLKAKVLSNCLITKSNFIWEDKYWSAFYLRPVDNYTSLPLEFLVGANEKSVDQSSFHIDSDLHTEAPGIHVITLNITVEIDLKIYNISHTGYFYRSCDIKAQCFFLYYNTDFNFYATLGKSINQSCTDVTNEFQSQGSLNMEIICLWNCSPGKDMILNGFDPHVDAVLATSFHGSHLQQEFKWNVYVCSYFYNISTAKCDNLVLEKAGSYKLLMPTSLWNPEGGATYMITFSGQTFDKTEKSACAFLNMNAVPTGGSCSVSPLSGIAGVTEFLFICTGFIDDNIPLSYRFFLQKNTSIEDKGYLVGGGINIAHVRHIVDTSGEVGSLCILTFQIMDTVGAFVQVKKLFEVVAQRDTENVKVISNAINKIQNVENNDEDAADILDIVSNIVRRSKTENWLNGTEREVTIFLQIVTSSINNDQADSSIAIPVEEQEERKRKRSEVRGDVIEMLTKVNKIENIIHVQKICTLLNNITAVQEEVSDKAQSQASEVYSNLASSLKVTSHSYSEDLIKDTVSVLINGAIKLLAVSRQSGENLVKSIDSMKKTSEQSITQKKNTSEKLMSTVEQVVDVVLTKMTVGGTPAVYETEEMSVEVHALRPEQLVGKSMKKNMTQTNSEDLISTFTFPNSTSMEKILGTTSNSSKGVGVQLIFSKKNPYFWSKDLSSVTTPVLNLKLKNLTSQSDISVKNLTDPMFLSFTNTKRAQNILFRTVTLDVPFDYNGSIAKIQPSVRSMSVFNVSRPTVQTGSYIISIAIDVSLPVKVLVQGEVMPKLHDILKNGTRIPKDNSILSSYQMLHEDESVLFISFSSLNRYELFYIGIAIDETVIKGKRLIEELLQHANVNCTMACAELTLANCTAICHRDLWISVNITVKTYSAACLYWDAEKQSWSQEGCTVAPYTTEDNIYCWCSHLSSFSGGFIVIPNDINPFKEMIYFTSFFSNPVVVNTVVVVWIFYLAVLYWARQEDNKDVYMRNVHNLPNNPCDAYYYLICVVTHWGKDAGTTANVYIQLKGKRDYSSKLHLSDVCKRFFKSGTEDWFLLATPNSLGELTSLDVWHDGFGMAPAWSLNQIVVKDLQMRKSWIFFFNNWLSTDRGVLKTSVNLKAAPLTKRQKHKKSNFLLRSSRDMRNSHLWFGIFRKPAISHFTRVQRLSCALCLILTTMLTNIMFQGIPTDDPDDQLKFGDISVSLTVIVIGVESSLIMFPINTLLVLIFNRVKRKPKDINPYPRLDFEESKMNDKVNKILVKETTGNDEHEQNTPGHSVNLEKEEEYSTESYKCLPWWFIYVGWFILVNITVVCSFFVMLYGLKYGYRKSMDWLVASLVAVVQSAVVTQPVKVICIAVIITIFLRKPVEIEKEKSKKDIAQNEMYFNDVVKPTNLKENVPVPPSKKTLEKLRQKQYLDNKISIDLHNIAVYSIMFFIIMVIAYGFKPVTTAFHCNKAVEDIFINAAYGNNFLAVDQVATVDLLWEYLYVTVVPILVEMSEKDENVLTLFSNYYIVGSYRLRQLRIRNDSCVFPFSGHFDNISDYYCSNSQFYGQIDDTNHYNDNWNKKQNGTSTKTYDPWKYQTSSQLGTISYTGKHATYSGGGYVLVLTANQSQDGAILRAIQTSNWIDDKTKAVFLEFTLYNPNVDLFTMVFILFEFTRYGNLNSNVEISTAKLHLLRDTSLLEVITAVCEVLFLVMTILRTFNEMNRFRYLNKKKEYLKNIWTYTEIFQLVLSYNMILYFLQRLVSVNRIMSEFVESDGSKFISFHDAMSFDQMLGDKIVVLIAAMLLTASKYLEINKMLRLFIRPLREARSMLVALYVFTIPFIIAFASLLFLLYGRDLEKYRNFSSVLFTLFSQLLGILNKHEQYNSINTFSSQFVCFSSIFLFKWCFMSLFTAVIIFHVRKWKNNVNVHRDSDFSKHFWKRIQSYFIFTDNET